MGLVGSTLRCFFGVIAGALRLGPFFLGELLGGEALPAYDDSKVIELGVAALKNDEGVKGGDFDDVYFTSKDGTRLHAVTDSGRRRVKGKRPIVFVHGFPELWISWIDQMKHFSRLGHPVVALSMRGYGLSDKPTGGIESFHAYNNIMEDIRAAVKYATKNYDGDGAPLLVGHDWGASLCWMYATQGKTTKDCEIAGYASLALPPGECFEANMGLKQLWASLYILFFNMPWLPEKVMLANNAWMIGKMMNATKTAKIPAWMTSTYRANCLQQGAMTGQLNYYRNLVQREPKPDPADVLGPKNEQTGRRLELPVLMIRGKDDDALPGGIFVGYDKYLSNARLVALDNCSHWITADCPNEVNQEIEMLLKEL